MVPWLQLPCCKTWLAESRDTLLQQHEVIVSIHSFSPRNAHSVWNWWGGYPSLQALSPDDDMCHSILHPSVIRSKFDVSCCDIRIRQPHFVLMFFLLSYPPSFLFGYLERLVRSHVYFPCMYSSCWRTWRFRSEIELLTSLDLSLLGSDRGSTDLVDAKGYSTTSKYKWNLRGENFYIWLIYNFQVKHLHNLHRFVRPNCRWKVQIHVEAFQRWIVSEDGCTSAPVVSEDGCTSAPVVSEDCCTWLLAFFSSQKSSTFTDGLLLWHTLTPTAHEKVLSSAVSHTFHTTSLMKTGSLWFSITSIKIPTSALLKVKPWWPLQLSGSFPLSWPMMIRKPCEK